MKSFKQTKIYFALVLLSVCSIEVNAQITNLTNATVAHDTVPKRSSQPGYLIKPGNTNDTVIENRLVQLALAQPNYAQTLYQQKIFEYQLKKQRSSWLNLLTLSTTYNDQSFAKPSGGGTTAYVYPKFYFGISIPLGLIVANSTDVKITRQSELIAKSQQEELAKSIKASVLTNYKQYRANEKLLVIQNQAVDDEQANFLSIEQKFRSGTATLDAYNEASKKYNDEVVKAINLQLQQDLIKVELERLIGRKLEDVIK